MNIQALSQQIKMIEDLVRRQETRLANIDNNISEHNQRLTRLEQEKIKRRIDAMGTGPTEQ